MFTVITGGAASGKSKFAEDLAVKSSSNKLYYIATMMIFDDEGEEKVNRHRIMRKSKGFNTIECPFDLKSVKIKSESTVLLECMSNLLANEIYSEGRNREKAIDEILEGINNLNNKSVNLIVVTNEVFSDSLKYDSDTEDYIKRLGEINRKIANLADEVIEVVYSIPIYHKKAYK